VQITLIFRICDDSGSNPSDDREVEVLKVLPDDDGRGTRVKPLVQDLSAFQLLSKRGSYGRRARLGVETAVDFV
jgi:hypothetical protein